MIKPNQIQSFETWQEAFDGVKRAVDEYHMKFWEELEKMTKIDESKQYKFSEIIAMLEEGLLPEMTKVLDLSHGVLLYVQESNACEFGLTEKKDPAFIETDISSVHINALWTIELPELEKFYLKAPFKTKKQYLHYCSDSKEYFFHSTTNETYCCSNKFTQREIDRMTFDTDFFEKVKVEDKIND